MRHYRTGLLPWIVARAASLFVADKLQLVLRCCLRKKIVDSRLARNRSGSKRIVSGGDDQRLKMWDAESGSDLLTLVGHTGPIFGVSMNSDGKRLLSASLDRTAKVWDADTGEELLTLRGHDSYVFSVAASKDGRLIVSSGYDGTVRLWQADVDDQALTLRGHGDKLRGAAGPIAGLPRQERLPPT